MKRPLVFFLLFGLFLLVFVVTPLWARFPGPPARAGALALSLIAGFAWAWWGSGSLRLPFHGFRGLRGPPGRAALSSFSALSLLSPLLLLALLAAMNARALSASIPWRGDEDHHIVFTWDLSEALASRPWYLAVPLLVAAWGSLHPSMNRRVVAGAAALGLLAALVGYQDMLPGLERNSDHAWYHVLRYPILLKYAAAVPVFLHSLLPGEAHPEWPYRVLPLAASAGLSWLGFHALRRRSPGIRFGAAAAIATLPLVRYYSSILYLEMPAVLCMTAVCFQASRLLRAVPERLVRMPAWYALLLVGFIKETALPFLAAYACCRIAVRLPRLSGPGASPWKARLGEARVLFCAGFPLFLYLFYRSCFGNFRPYSLWLTNLADLHLPLRLSLSLLEGFALLLPLALAGVFLGAARGRRRAPTAFLVLALILSAAFHYLDDYHFIGYSRFNLFLLPSVIALAWQPLRLAARYRPSLTAAGLVLATAVNILLSPVNSDGTKKPLWGVHGVDTGEHYYPYREALEWLEAEHPGRKARLTGHYYAYFARFYRRGRPLEQVLVEKPADEAALMDAALAAAGRDGVEVLLYHVLGDFTPPASLHGYRSVKVFRNQAHSLVQFSR